MAVVGVRVQGLAELEKAFKLAGPVANKGLRLALREVAEPVRRDAEALARGRITRIGVPWSQMRVGVTQRFVYVAPKQRGVKSRTDRRFRRPNFFDLLMGRSLEPALERNTALIETGLGHALDTVGRAWESV